MTAKDRLVEQNCKLAELRRLAERKRRARLRALAAVSCIGR
jgi:hypothetical protein